MAIIQKGYMSYDDRVFHHPGPVIDIGCVGWNWSNFFLGRKKVIGYDPFETRCQAGAILVTKCVSVSEGTSKIFVDPNVHDPSLFVTSGKVQEIDTVSISGIIKEYGEPSILKMNIEGMEFPILASVLHPIADQLVVSFHDDSWTQSQTYPQSLTDHIVDYLSEWYEAVSIFPECRWYLFLKKDKEQA